MLSHDGPSRVRNGQASLVQIPRGSSVKTAVAIVALVVALAIGASAQNECGVGLQNLPILNAADIFGTVHKNACWDAVNKILTFPLGVSGGTGTPGGPTNSIQFNAGGGNFGGSANHQFASTLFGVSGIPAISLRSDGLAPTTAMLDMSATLTLGSGAAGQINAIFNPTTVAATGDIRVFNIGGTIAGAGGTSNTWTGIYNQFTHQATSGTITHAFINTSRATESHSTGATCTLCFTQYTDQTLTNMNGTMPSGGGIFITGNGAWTGTGTITEWDGINESGPSSKGSLTYSFETGTTLGDPGNSPAGASAGLVIGAGFQAVTAGTRWGIYQGVSTPTGLNNLLQGRVGVNTSIANPPAGTVDVSALSGLAALRFTGESAGTSNIFTGLDGVHANGVFQLDGGGHLGSHNVAVTVTGTGCAAGDATSNDEFGFITLSAGAATCTITFSGTTFSAGAHPICTLSAGNSTQNPFIVAAPTTTSFQITSAAASGNIYYHCFWEK